MSKHTPGPWSFRRGTSDFTGHPILVIDSKESYGGIAGIHSDEPEDEANARLIAAAPDLLVACKESLEMIGHNHWDNTQQHGQGCPLCIRQREIQVRILAAIAKAEGTS